MNGSSIRSLRAATVAALACVAASCVSSSPVNPAGKSRDLSAATFDAVFEEVMTRYRLPGLVLGVVVDGEVVYSRAADEVVAGGGQAITPATLFKIGSNSKAMTTGVMARLVDAGVMRWDDPVTRYLPQFRMYDPWVTREMQVRDLLVHNSGLREGAGDLMLWPEPNLFTRSDIIAGLVYLQPVSSFRSRYAYDNLLYIVAGEVAAAAAGISYEQLVRREVFEPLDMGRCQVGEFQRDAVGNVAQPHMRTPGGNVVVRPDAPTIPFSTSAPAGGIRCSLNDMLKWVRMWLEPANRGSGAGDAVADGKPWISAAQREILWAAHMPMPLSQRQRAWDGSRFYAYGYGWRVSDVDGVLRVAHTGTLMGMYSAVTLLPELGTGFVFMINGEGSDARTVLNAVLVKRLIGHGEAPPLSFYADALDRAAEQLQSAGAPAESLPRQQATPASLQRWLGTYRDPWFGEVSLCQVGDRVVFTSARSTLLTGPVMEAGGRRLVDWTDDSVDAEAWLDLSDAAPPAGVATLRMSKVDPSADFSYDYEDLRFLREGDCP